MSDFGLCKTLNRVTQDNKSYVMTGNTGTRRSAGIPSRSARRARAVQKRDGESVFGELTGRVFVRRYMAPEVVLSDPNYDEKVESSPCLPSCSILTS